MADIKGKITEEDLQHGLKARHMQMIAIGGAIGVGFFYGASGSIKYAGPAVLLVYAIAGLAVFLSCRAIGEIAVEEPEAGALAAYASRYVHPFLGFAIGWTGLFGGIAVAGAEVSALGAYVQYWFPDVPVWGTGLVSLAVIIAINLISVKIYGEMEFRMSAIKVVAIIAMMVCGVFIITGVTKGSMSVVENFTASGGFFPNGVQGLLYALVLVAFAFAARITWSARQARPPM